MIVSVSLARNDADIIEAFVRHHARWIDRMLILCHFSQDRTPQILRALSAEGFPLDISEDNGIGRLQSHRATELMRAAVARYEPDWILPLDVDEFLVSLSDNDPRTVLDSLPPDRVVLIPWRSYVPTPSDDPDEPNALHRIQHRRESELNPWSKAGIPVRLARARHAVIAAGNHGLVNGKTDQPFPTAETDRLALAHFPVRSERQLRVKVLGNWLSYLTEPHRKRMGFHLRMLFDECRQEKPISSARLREIALTYACKYPPKEPEANLLIVDPVDATFGLRYAPGSVPPLEVVAQIAERLAETIAGQGSATGRLRSRLRLMRNALARHRTRLKEALFPAERESAEPQRRS